MIYLPFLGIIQRMRERLGFRALADAYDDSVNHLALVRNCLMHNGGRVDAKLAYIREDLHENEKISLALADVNSAVNVLRKFAYEIDKSFENIAPQSDSI